jgi:hypothetical protein
VKANDINLDTSCEKKKYLCSFNFRNKREADNKHNYYRSRFESCSQITSNHVCFLLFYVTTLLQAARPFFEEESALTLRGFLSAHKMCTFRAFRTFFSVFQCSSENHHTFFFCSAHFIFLMTSAIFAFLCAVHIKNV